MQTIHLQNNMNIKFCLFVASLFVGFSSNALTVTTEAGNLKSSVGQNTDASTLIVKGQLNASDFEFIADNMKNLTSLDISDVEIVAYSGEKLFTGKTSAKANILPDYALTGTNLTTINLPSTLIEIGEGALSSTPLTQIIIPESVTTIGMGAFSNCDGLTTITIPSGVKTLSSHVFSNCDKLISANITNISVINEYTFSQCNELQNILISENLSEIKNSAFNGCSALQSFSFGDKLSLIGDNAFKFSGLTTIDMSKCSNLKSIGSWAFAECYALTSVLLNDNTAKIGEGAFFNDIALTELNIPTSCKHLSDYILKGTCNLDSSTISSATVDSIGAYALMGWSQITIITLPASITHIGDNAFEDWTGLTKIYAGNLKTVVPTLGDSVWQDLNRQDITLVVADNMEGDFRSMAQWQDFKITTTTGSDRIEDLYTNSETKIYFIGNDLIIEAESNIVSVDIYNTIGYQLIADKPNDIKHTINTSEWSARIYIVNVRLDNGTVTTVKVARQ